MFLGPMAMSNVPKNADNYQILDNSLVHFVKALRNKLNLSQISGQKRLIVDKYYVLNQ